MHDRRATLTRMAKAHTTWTVLSHDPIEKLSERLWRVEGASGPMRRVMAIAKRTDGTLAIHNAIALDDAEMAELDAWGKVSVLIVPNGYHRMDARIFKDRYPDAKVLCPAAARKRVEQVVPVDGTYEDFPADPAVELVTLDGTKQREGVMLVHDDAGTSVVINDAVFNMPHVSGFTGFVLRRITGSSGGPRVSRVSKWLVVADKPAFRAHLERLAQIPDLRRILVSHHEMITNDPGATLAGVAASM